MFLELDTDLRGLRGRTDIPARSNISPSVRRTIEILIRATVFKCISSAGVMAHQNPAEMSVAPSVTTALRATGAAVPSYSTALRTWAFYEGQLGLMKPKLKIQRYARAVCATYKINHPPTDVQNNITLHIAWLPSFRAVYCRHGLRLIELLQRSTLHCRLL